MLHLTILRLRKWIIPIPLCNMKHLNRMVPKSKVCKSLTKPWVSGGCLSLGRHYYTCFFLLGNCDRDPLSEQEMFIQTHNSSQYSSIVYIYIYTYIYKNINVYLESGWSSTFLVGLIILRRPENNARPAAAARAMRSGKVARWDHWPNWACPMKIAMFLWQNGVVKGKILTGNHVFYHQI